MPATYEPIATTTLSSAASTITFSSIPSTYTDLRLVLAVTDVSSSATIRLVFNSDTGTNYSRTNLYGDGSSVISNRTTNATNITMGNAITAGTTAFFNADIFSYAGATNKTALININNDRNGSGFVFSMVSLWRSTSAINQIEINHNGGTMSTGTTATLYGIKAA